jgi:hypothetical protein
VARRVLGSIGLGLYDHARGNTLGGFVDEDTPQKVHANQARISVEEGAL